MLTESKRSYRSLIYSAGRNITEISIEEINEERERESESQKESQNSYPIYVIVQEDDRRPLGYFRMK